MNPHYTTRGAGLTPEIKAYCERRLGELKRLFPKIIDVDIIFTVEKKRHKAEISLRAKGGVIVVQEETMDMMDSLKRAFDNLENKVKKDREKWREQKRRGGRERKEMPPAEETAEPRPRLVRSANFSFKPMSHDEALLELGESGREVFMFRRDESERWAVVYRTRDGNIGLIEPE